MIAVDAHHPSPDEVRLRELALRAAQSGFTVAVGQLGNIDVLIVERSVGDFIDRMILNLRLGMPSMITRFQWDSNYPWIDKPQPAPVDYVQGDAAEVIEVALAWNRQ